MCSMRCQPPPPVCTCALGETEELRASKDLPATQFKPLPPPLQQCSLGPDAQPCLKEELSSIANQYQTLLDQIAGAAGGDFGLHSSPVQVRAW